MLTFIAGKEVGPIGFGLASIAQNNALPPRSRLETDIVDKGLTAKSPPTPYDEACKVLKIALEKGANLWNGGQFYGPQNASSLQLLNHYFTLHPSDAKRVVLSMKGCFNHPTYISEGPPGPDCSPKGIKTSIEKCLEVLGGKVCIDIFEPARLDPNVPVEDTMETLSEYVKAGKIGGIGLSEVNTTTIRRAHAVHPLSAVEIELSLFTIEPLTNGILDTCAELNIPVVAYSPLSKGWLTGQINHLDDIPQNFGRLYPRFHPDAFGGNLKLVQAIENVARRKGCSLPQVALAWVIAMGKGKSRGGPIVVPIPGCKSVDRVKENLTSVELDETDLNALEKILGEINVCGDRYGESLKKYMNM
jgi:pyridoxine 4-dehydrogenase